MINVEPHRSPLHWPWRAHPWPWVCSLGLLCVPLLLGQSNCDTKFPFLTLQNLTHVQVSYTTFVSICQRYKVTRSSAVAVIADRTACKFAVCTPLRVVRSLQLALGSLGTRIGGRTEWHCADARPYKRRYMCIGTQVRFVFCVAFYG